MPDVDPPTHTVGSSETLNGLRSISPADRKLRAEGWQVIELHDGVFRKPLAQIVGQRLRSSVVSRICQRERGAVLHIAACRGPIANAARRRASAALPNKASRRADIAEYVAAVSFSSACSAESTARRENSRASSKPPGIGGSISFVGEQHVLHSRLARCPRYLLRHPRRIVLQKSNLVQADMEERVIQFAFECLPIGGLRLVKAIKSDVTEHEDGVSDGIVRIQTDCLVGFFNGFFISSKDRANDPRQKIVGYLRPGISLGPERHRLVRPFPCSL